MTKYSIKNEKNRLLKLDGSFSAYGFFDISVKLFDDQESADSALAAIIDSHPKASVTSQDAPEKAWQIASSDMRLPTFDISILGVSNEN